MGAALLSGVTFCCAAANSALRRRDHGVPRCGSGKHQSPFVYRVRAPTRPFVRAGVSFNRVFDISGTTECGRGPFGKQFYCLEGSKLAELRHRGTFGFVVGVGFGSSS